MTEDKKQVVSQLGFFFSDAADQTDGAAGDEIENDPLPAIEVAEGDGTDLHHPPLTDDKKTAQARPKKTRTPRKKAKTTPSRKGQSGSTDIDAPEKVAESSLSPAADAMFVSVTHQQNNIGGAVQSADITADLQSDEAGDPQPKPRKKRVSRKARVKPENDGDAAPSATDNKSVDKTVDKKSKNGLKKTETRVASRRKNNKNNDLDQGDGAETGDLEKTDQKVENRSRKKTVKSTSTSATRQKTVRKKTVRKNAKLDLPLQSQFDLTPPQFDLLGDPIRPSTSEKKAALSADLSDVSSEPEDDGHMQIDLEELLSDHQIDIVESLEDLPVAPEKGDMAPQADIVAPVKVDPASDLTAPAQSVISPEIDDSEKIVKRTRRKRAVKSQKTAKKPVVNEKASTDIMPSSSFVISGQAKQLSRELAQLQDQTILARKSEMMIPDISDLFSDESRFMGRGLFLHSLSEWWRVRGDMMLPLPQSWDEFLPPAPDMGLDVDAGELWTHFVILKWPQWEKYPEFLFTGQKLQSFFSELAESNDQFAEQNREWEEMSHLSKNGPKSWPKNWTEGQKIFYSYISELSDSARLSFLPVSKTTKLTPFPFAMCLMMLPFGQEHEKTADHLLGVLHYRQFMTDLNK